MPRLRRLRQSYETAESKGYRPPGYSVRGGKYQVRKANSAGNNTEQAGDESNAPVSNMVRTCAGREYGLVWPTEKILDLVIKHSLTPCR